MHFFAEKSFRSSLSFALTRSRARAQTGMTPLHWAAHGGHEEATVLLLSRGAPAGAANADGWTPLHYASCAGHTHVARALVRAGADAGVANAAGRTSLQVCAQREGDGREHFCAQKRAHARDDGCACFF
jgi:ankyrin repeat protein